MFSRLISYDLNSVRTAIERPEAILGELNWAGTRLNKSYYRRRGTPTGVDVMAEEWDNLLILDACRYDALEDVTPFDAPVEKRRSRGSNSWEFMKANFVGQTHHDTVYVSANPYTTDLDPEIFHDVVHLLHEEWDDDLDTVRPETVAERAREVATEYPHKRLLVHFMQPHTPYIGPRGRSLERRAAPTYIWDAYRYGMTDVTMAEIRDVYMENLELVLDIVVDLVTDLAGKCVVTADHGELLGDRLRPIPVTGYEHEPHLHVPGLLDVPWIELDGETRRETVAEPPTSTIEIDEETRNDRLEALGYRDA